MLKTITFGELLDSINSGADKASPYYDRLNCFKSYSHTGRKVQYLKTATRAGTFGTALGVAGVVAFFILGFIAGAYHSPNLLFIGACLGFTGVTLSGLCGLGISYFTILREREEKLTLTEDRVLEILKQETSQNTAIRSNVAQLKQEWRARYEDSD